MRTRPTDGLTVLLGFWLLALFGLYLLGAPAPSACTAGELTMSRDAGPAAAAPATLRC